MATSASYWSSAITGTGNPQIYWGNPKIKTDSNGNTYTIQVVSAGSVTHKNGDGTVYSTVTYTSVNIVVTKYNSVGAIQWITNIAAGGTSAPTIHGFEVDSSGDVYISGMIWNDNGNLSIGGSTILTKPANSGAYGPLIKLTTAGALSYAFVPVTGNASHGTFTTALKCIGNDVYVIVDSGTDSASTTLSVLNQNGTTFRTYSGPGAGVVRTPLIKYNRAGVCQFAFIIMSTALQRTNQLDVDSAGNIYTGGFLRANVTYTVNSLSGISGETASAITLVAGTAEDGFIIAYNSSGVAQWARSLRASNTIDDNVRSILAVPGGVITASITNNSTSLTIYNGSSLVTTISLPALNILAGVYIFFSTAGVYQGNMRFLADNTNNHAAAYSIASDTSGNLYMAGMFGTDFKFYDICGSATAVRFMSVMDAPDGYGGSFTTDEASDYNYSSFIFKVSSAGRYVTHRVIQGTNFSTGSQLVSLTSPANDLVTVHLPTQGSMLRTRPMELLHQKILSIVFTPSTTTGSTQRLLDITDTIGGSTYFYILPTYNNGYFRVVCNTNGMDEFSYTSPTAVVTSTSTKYIVNVYFDVDHFRFSIGSINGTTITYLANSSLQQNGYGIYNFLKFCALLFGKSASGTVPYLNAAYNKISIITPASATTYYTDTNLATFTNLSTNNVITNNSNGSLYTFDNNTNQVTVTIRTNGGSPSVSTSALTIASNAYFDTPAASIYLEKTRRTPIQYLLKNPTTSPTSTYNTVLLRTAMADVPSAITDLSGYATSGTTASLSWSAPSNGGSTITNYNVFNGPTQLTGATTPAVSISGTTATITNCSFGTAYSFTVYAVNVVGTSTVSNTVSITTLSLPGAPTISGTPTVGNAQATLSWSAAATNGSAITNYRITSIPDGITKDVSGNLTTGTITGLTNGTAYTFTVTATNAAGTGPASVASTPAVTPFTTPSAPTSLTSVVNTATGDISLNWTAPAANGSAITSYNVYANGTLLSGVSTPAVAISGTSARITGATMGTLYSFNVSAVNAAGEGAQSSPLSVTPTRVPSTPSAPTAVAGNKKATLTWSTPSNGGSAITGYTIAITKNGVSAGTTTAGATDTSKNIIDLSNGATYTFTIAATNSVGTSSYSLASNSVKPDALPTGTVQIVDLVSGSQFDVGTTLETNASALADEDGSGALFYQWQIADTSSGTFANISGATDISYSPIVAHIGKYYRVLVSYTDGAGTIYSGATAIVSAVAGPVRARRPYAPIIGTATAGVTSARVTWSAPTNNGGATITSYIITSSPGGKTGTAGGSDLSGTVSGLTAGTSYTFTVQAVNSTGTGDSSAASNIVIPYTTPGAPQNVVATAGSSQVRLTWSAPSSEGYSTITEYRISYSWPPSNSGLIDLSANGLTDLSYSITGLTPGTQYSFYVFARNAADLGAMSSLATATPYTTPGAPRDVSATASYSGNSQITVSWTEPLSNGYNTITEYRVTDGSGNTYDVSGDQRNAIITGLIATRTYSYTVKAKNAAGYGTTSSPAASATAFGLPGTPVISTVTAGNKQVTVSWSAVAANGATVTNYRVTSNPDGFSTDTSGTSAVVTGLTNGVSYTFTVTATNAAGDSTSVVSSAVIPNVVPNAPTGVTASAGVLSATVSWIAPTDNSGTAVLGYKIYRVTPTPSGTPVADVSATVLSREFTGLSAGVSYSYYVVAYNAAGDGAISATSAGVIPYTTPDVPQNVVATAGSSQVALSWSAPATDGSSNITEYRITINGSSTVDVSANGLTDLSYSFTGLTPNAVYTYNVRAVNAAGPGTASANVTATPYTFPGAPTIVSVDGGNKQATLVWSAAAANSSAITNYRIVDLSGTVSKDVSGTITSTVFTGLTNGRKYRFTITATNAAGDGPASAASQEITPNALPTGSFTVVDLDAGSGSSYAVGHTLTTSNGISDEDGIPNGFTYQWQIADASSGTFTDISGATGANYVVLAANIGKFFRVVATFTDGAQNVETVTTTNVAGPAVSTVPYAPTIGTATRGATSATVTWTAPTNDGGSAITAYKIISTPDSITANITDPSANSGVITGLSAGVSYTFVVKAVNANGDGFESDSSIAVVPYTVPNAPTSVTAVAGKLSAVVSWIDPSDNYESIDYYTVKVYMNGSYVADADVSDAAAPITVSGLTKNQNYTFKVSATNAAGEGADSSASADAVIPYDVPDAPTLNEVYPGDRSVDIWFTAPFDNNAAIEAYKVIATVVDTSEQVIAIMAPPAGILLEDISGLRNGVPYSFYLIAVNKAGDSDPSYLVTTDYYGSPLILNAPPVDNVTIVRADTGISDEFYYVGQVLATDLSTNPAALSDYDGISGEISYQWCTVDTSNYPTLYYNNLEGETGPTLTLTRTHLNEVISVRLSYTDRNGRNESVNVAQYTNYIGSTAPGAPAFIDVSSTFGQIDVSWGSVFDGGVDIQGYKIYYRDLTNRDTEYQILDREDPYATNQTFTLDTEVQPGVYGLNIGHEYEFKVLAYNYDSNGGVRDGELTGAVSAVFFAAPRPSIIEAFEYYNDGIGQIRVGWNVKNIPEYMFARYEIYDAVNNVEIGRLNSLLGPWGERVNYIRDELDNILEVSGGITYSIKMRTVISYSGEEYTGEFSSASDSFTTVSYSDPPTNIQAVGGNGAITVSWGVPSFTGGRSVTSYRVEYNEKNGNQSGYVGDIAADVSSYEITGLMDGSQFKVSVQAITTYDSRYYDYYYEMVLSDPVQIFGISGEANGGAYIYTAPNAPYDVTAIVGVTSASVTWNVTSNTADAEITKYIIYSDPSNTPVEVLVADTTSPTTTHVFSGLTNGTTYTFTVVAQNATGDSAPSGASNAVTPRDVPAAPYAIYGIPLTNYGSAAVEVGWMDPSDNGAAITEYQVWAIDQSSDSVVADVSGAVGPLTVAGLTYGTAYKLRVAAYNEAGWGPSGESVDAVIPYTLPGTVTDLSAANGLGEVSLSWTVPANNGRQITKFVLYYNGISSEVTTPGGYTEGDVVASSVTLESRESFYTFTVRAYNLAGLGEASGVASAQSYDVPHAPTDFGCANGLLRNDLSWNAPVFTGHQPIEKYVLLGTMGGVQVLNVDLSANVESYAHEDLSAGVTYKYNIRVVTQNSQSELAGPVTGIPFDYPGVPTGVTADASDGYITVSWSAPADFGGAALEGYTVLVQDMCSNTFLPEVALDGSGLTVDISAGIINGHSYTAQVATRNVYLTSDFSTASSPAVIPSSLPGAPTDLSANAGDRSVRLTWYEPLQTGGVDVPILAYKVYNMTSGSPVEIMTVYDISASVDDLSNGQFYTFAVSAVNARGEGARSVSVTTDSVTNAPLQGSIEISGTFIEDSTLYVMSTLTDADGLGDFAYQWAAAGDDDIFLDLSGETESTITPDQELVGKKLRVTVRYVDGAGVLEMTTASIGPLANNNDPGSGLDISGLAAFGETLTAVTTNLYDQDGLPDPSQYEYKWYRSADGLSDMLIAGATSSTYDISRGDVNNKVRAAVLYTDLCGGANTVYSPYTATIPPYAPTAPTLTVVRGNTTAALSWTLPVWDGGLADISYSVWRSDSSGNNGVQLITTASRTYTATGLTNGVTYWFYVVAFNASAVSTSPKSNVASVVPGTVPTAVRDLSGSYASQQVILTWTAPESSGGYAIEGYKIELSGSLVTTVATDASSATITGLTNGTSYTYVVKAYNDVGDSSGSSLTIIPSTIPNAPLRASAVASFVDNSSAAIVSWDLPDSSGGAPILGYRIREVGQSTVLGTALGAATTTLTISGLTSMRSYQFSVFAYNKNSDINDTGANSAQTNSINTYGLPEAVQNLAAAFGNAQISLSWTAGSANGSDISGYQITYGATTFDVSSTSTTISGLTNGTNYTFTVRARNAAGLGAGTSVTEYPSTVPSMPRSVVATPANTQITLTWVAPLSPGGAAVTGYTINAWRTDLSGVEPVFTRTVGLVTSSTFADLSGVSLINNYNYSFQIAAINRAGTGPYAATVNATPGRVPNAPTDLVTTGYGNQYVDLSWNDFDTSANSGRELTGYIAYAYTNAALTSLERSMSPTPATNKTLRFTGLTNGTTYYFVVRGQNALGLSAVSNQVAEKPSTVPSTPATLAVAALEGAVGGLNFAAYTNGARIYNNSNNTFFGPDPYNAGSTSTNINDSWSPNHMLLNDDTNVNSTARSVKAYKNATTWTNPGANNWSYIIVDLGTERTFDKAYGYQTFSDGKTTHLSLAYAPAGVSYSAGNDSRLTYASNTWVSIFHDQLMTDASTGFNLEKVFTPVTARYIRVGARNDGRYQSPVYTELYNIKLFSSPDATLGDSKLPLTWAAPNNGGDTISKYTLTWSAGGVQVGTIDLSGTAISRTIEDLINGTSYSVSITATNRSGTSTATTITSTPGRAPLAPTDLVTTGYGNQYVDLSWNDLDTSANSGRELIGYTAYAYTDASLNNLAFSLAPAPATNKTLRFTGLTNGTVYRFVVKSQNSLGFSAASNTVTEFSRTTPTKPVVTINPVTGHGDGSVTITWSLTNNSGLPINKFRAYADLSGTILSSGDLSGTTSTYTFTGLTNGTVYTFTVESFNDLGSTTSDPKTEYPSKVPEAPAAPSITGYDISSIGVSWVAPATNGAAITGYKLYRSTAGGAFNLVSPGPSGAVLSYTDRGLTAGTFYAYKVLATNRDGDSAQSAASLSEKPSAKPTVPTGLRIAGHGDGTIDLSWNASTSNGDSVTYLVYRSLTDSSFNVVDWSGAATYYRSTGMTNGTTYYFKVSARNRDGESAQSSSVNEFPSKKPEPPTSITFPAHTISTITINWEGDISNGDAISKYTVYRASEMNGSYQKIADLSGTVRTYTNTNLTAGTTYYYKISATNRDGESIQSAAAFEKPSAIPTIPTGLRVTGHGNGTIDLSWNASTSNGDPITYYVYRSTTDNSFNVVDWSGSATSYRSTGMTNGTVYYFAVAARNRDGESPKSSSVSEYPSKVPDAPVLVVSGFGYMYIDLSWNAPNNNGADISGYKIWDASTNTLLFTVDGNTRTYKHTGLEIGIRRYYYVTAHNRDGSSAVSNIVNEIPIRNPGVPYNIVVTQNPDKFIITWDVDPYGDTINESQVTCNLSLKDATNSIFDYSGNSVTITGLTIGQYYQFQVRARNRLPNGWSEFSGLTIPKMFVTRPAAPTNVTVVKGDTFAQMTWLRTSDYGGPDLDSITHNIYSATGNPPFTTAFMTMQSCTILGLTNDISYNFVVKTYNGYFESLPSAVVTVTPSATVVVGEKFTSLDPETNIVFVGEALPVAPQATEVVLASPNIYEYPVVKIANLPVEDGIDKVTIQVTPEVPAVEPDKKSVVIDVKIENAVGERIRNLSNTVTVTFTVYDVNVPSISIFYRAEVNQEFTYFKEAYPVPGMLYTYSFETNRFSQYKGDYSNYVPCVVAGTKILTTGGYKKVEDLEGDDRVVTSEGRAVPFVRMSTHIVKTDAGTAPYRIAAHAFGRNSPPAPVTLSGLHAIQIRRGVWHFPVALAKTHRGVSQVGVGAPVTYYHVRLPNYLRDNLVVEGGAVIESLGGSKKYSAEKVYTYSERLGGFTRVSAAQFDKISHV